MPINNKYKIDELLAACRKYCEKTGRRVSFEYTLIKDVNDSKENALELATRLKGMNAHVNLIPVNDVKERGNIKSSKKAILNFQNILKKTG